MLSYGKSLEKGKVGRSSDDAVLGDERDALRVEHLKSTSSANPIWTYSYDPLSRLKQDTTSGNTTAWSYDAGNNLSGTSDSATATSSTRSFDAAHQLSTLLKTVNGATTNNLTYSYNANGDRTGATDSVTSTSTTYGYNQNDQLTSYTSGATSAAYSYDGTGLRASKTVGGTSEGFAWNLAEGLPTIIQDAPTVAGASRDARGRGSGGRDTACRARWGDPPLRAWTAARHRPVPELQDPSPR